MPMSSGECGFLQLYGETFPFELAIASLVGFLEFEAQPEAEERAGSDEQSFKAAKEDRQVVHACSGRDWWGVGT